MRSLQYMIDVMTAAHEGKRIQVNNTRTPVNETDWVHCNPSWNWAASDYRIAPEPQKAREFWIAEGPIIDTDVNDRPIRTSNGKVFVVKMPDTIHVREVLPGDK